jgi:glucokinase
MRTAIGIDIGGTNIRAARISSDGRIHSHQSLSTKRSALDVLTDLEKCIDTLREQSTAAVGIGIPGRVDARTGHILSGGFVDLSGLDLAERLHALTGLPAFCDNDANMALAAEACIGAARGVTDAVMLTIGTGIGGAIFAGGRMFHGGGMAGQLGHITVSLDGMVCNCGRKGCLETESSGTALQRHMAAAGFASGTSVEDILNSSSEESQCVIAAWASPLRAGLDSLSAAFSPQLIVLGGGLGAAACRALERYPAISTWFQYEVAAAQLGDEAGVIGAGLTALGRVA